MRKEEADGNIRCLLSHSASSCYLKMFVIVMLKIVWIFEISDH